ncbi:MAG: ankyrin repeat protein [uncultured bacterium]|nr:MAG: ankyrin repeat protein [uncultured bacterium]
MIELMVSLDINFNQIDRNGETMLHNLAYMKDSFNIANLLLKNGAIKSVDKPDNNGCTPFHIVCRYGNYKILELFLKYCSIELINELINKSDFDGRTPLHHACMGRNSDILNLLFENGATKSINEPDNKKKTPLHIACENNASSSAKILLENGAIKSIDKLTQEEMSPLFIACHIKNAILVKLLLENGARSKFSYGEQIFLRIIKIDPEILRYITLAADLDDSENKLNFVKQLEKITEHKDFLCKRLLTKHEIVYYKD